MWALESDCWSSNAGHLCNQDTLTILCLGFLIHKIGILGAPIP